MTVYMKLHSIRLAKATAFAFAVVWLLITISLWLFSGMDMMDHMQHTDGGHMGWHSSVSLLLLGGLIWSTIGGFTAWLIAEAYNRFN